MPPSLPRNSVPPQLTPLLRSTGELGHRRAREACQGLKFLLPSCVKGQSLRPRLGGWPGLCSAAALPQLCRSTYGLRAGWRRRVGGTGGACRWMGTPRCAPG